MKWKVPRMWENGEVWIIGGGPSVTQQFGVPEKIVQKVIKGELPPSAYSPYMSAIHDRHVIGVNAAFLIGDWMDLVFFGDREFLRKYYKELARFPGLRVTMFNSKYAGEEVQWVKTLKKDKRPTGISDDPRSITFNANSGAASISIAANAGAKTIVLVGFDMKLSEDGKQWWHTFYTKGDKIARGKLPFSRHLKGFPQIAKDARRRDIEIINASPDSAIKQFKKAEVKDLL